jgi:hypothetical protein
VPTADSGSDSGRVSVGFLDGGPVSYRDSRRPFHVVAGFPLHPHSTADGRVLSPAPGSGTGDQPDGPPTGPPAGPTASVRTGWSAVEVAGRVAAWFWPEAVEAASPGPVLMHLPGLPRSGRGERRRQEERIGVGLEFIGPRDRLLVETVGLPALVPDGGECWWLDRVVPSFHPTMTPAAFLSGPCRAEIERACGQGRHPSPPAGVPLALSGIGMGGQAALGFAYRHPERFPVVAAIDPVLDFHLVMRDDLDGAESLREAFLEVEHARQQTAILHVHPLNWPRHQLIAVDPGQAELREGVERLRGKLAALGIPHELAVVGGDGAIPPAAAWLRQSLESESRRLPSRGEARRSS